MSDDDSKKMIPVSEVRPTFGLMNRASRSTVAVIDAIVQRGGFRGEELSTIGQLRDNCIQLTQMYEAFDSEYDSDDEE